MEWIDSHCVIGKSNAPHPFAFKTTGDIKEELVRVGIEGALAYHAYAKDYHPYDGNEQLLAEISDDPFFKPILVVLPGYTAEFPPLSQVGAMLSQHRVAGVKCFPDVQIHSFSMQEWSMGETYDYLEQTRMPLFIDLDQVGWDGVHRILSNHSKLVLVVTSVGYRNARSFYKLLNDFPNLYLELSLYKNFLGIEGLVSKFGSERFLFGTGMPTYSAGPCKHMIESADIPEHDKQNIAAGNIKRLLEGISYE